MVLSTWPVRITARAFESARRPATNHLARPGTVPRRVGRLGPLVEVGGRWSGLRVARDRRAEVGAAGRGGRPGRWWAWGGSRVWRGGAVRGNGWRVDGGSAAESADRVGG